MRLDMTATAYLNNMGGMRSHSCNEIAIEIWEWCKDRNIWLTAAHLLGTQNGKAYRMSRKLNDNIEWMLDRTMFKSIIVGRYGLQEVCLQLGSTLSYQNIFHGCQTLMLGQWMHSLADSVEFHVDNLLKQSKPGNVGIVVNISAFPEDERLCAVRCIEQYIKLT